MFFPSLQFSAFHPHASVEPCERPRERRLSLRRSRGLRQRLQLLAVLLAWFMATGSQWDLVQTFGWARMIVTYAQTMPVLKAVQRTFDGELCGVCELVSHVRHQDSSHPAAPEKSEAKKFILHQPAPEFVAPAAETTVWSPGDRKTVSALRARPPTPPPRA